MRQPRETDLVRDCLQLLALRGVFAWRCNSGAMLVGRRLIRFNSEPGMSDILAVVPPNGLLLAVEAKMPRNRPTEAQQNFLDAVRRKGGVGVVVHSVRELEEALDGII